MDKNNVGVIGQKYEDRKTGKEGTLTARQEDGRQLVMETDDGESFLVSYSAFRSNWRKAKIMQIVEASDDEEESEDVGVYAEAGSEASTEPMTIEEFKHFVFSDREGKMAVNENVYEVVMDERGTEITVVRIEAMPGFYWVKMLPDVYTFSNFEDHVLDVKFDVSERSSVICYTDYKSIEDVLGAIAEAVRDINLYGYVMTEE